MEAHFKMRDVIKFLTKTHHYRVTGDYWSRIGAMCKRYEVETVMEAVKTLPDREITLDHMLNLLELRCQYIIENGEIDEITAEILNIGE